MIVLGIETSCDETSVALVGCDRQVHAHITRSQLDLHRAYGGVVPEMAARDHLAALDPMVRQALAGFAPGLDGVDAVAAIRKLAGAIYHVHGKDCYVDNLNIAVNGCNDNKPYDQILNRAWTFRSIGYGHGAQVWKDIISALRLVGYDYVISIEHEDALMSTDEGLAKGVAMLEQANIFEQPGEMFWA